MQTLSKPARVVSPRSGKAALVVVAVLLIIVVGLGGCVASKYNGLVAGEERVDGAFSEIDNQYKRRNDAIPMLVETIKGSANFEESVLTQVVEARASVGKVESGAVPSDPQGQAEYIEAQQSLGTAIGRLLLVAEAYPDLKTTSGFRDLQAQIEGTENRIAVARRDYIEAIKGYNTSLRKFPGNIVGGFFGFEKKPQLEAATAAEREVPEIDFGQDG